MLSYLLVFAFTIIKIKADKGTTCPISGIPSTCYTKNNNPCDAASKQNYYPSCTSYCHFIQCNEGTTAFDMVCGPGTVWDPTVEEYGGCNHPSVKPQDSEETCVKGGRPKKCYDDDENSPCDPLVKKGVYYYPSCTGYCNFIQCDGFGGAFEMPTAQGTVWDQSILGINYPAKRINALNDMDDIVNVAGAENTSGYYGYIVLIGVIAFILINNIFIGCWCMGKGKNKSFDMVRVHDEI